MSILSCLISTVPVAFSERNSFTPIPIKSVKLSRRGKGSKRRAQDAAQDSAPKHPRVDNTELSHNGLETMGSNSNSNPAHHSARDRRPGRRSQAGSSQTNYPQNGLANNTISTSIPTPTPQYGYGSGYSSYMATPPDYVADSNQYPTGNTNGGAQMPFGSFDIPGWNPQAMNYDPTATPPSMPMPMPMMDPRLFASIMGNMQGQFPMMPFNNAAPFQGVQAQPMSTMARPPGPIIHGQKPGPSTSRPRQRESTPPVDIPSATAEYMKQSSQKPTRCPTPRPLLIILDLNGTLVYRKHKKLPPSFVSRAGLEHFLDVLTKKYAVMIWSSSQPATVEAICARIFSKEKKRNLVALWGRDRFGLTPVQYHAKLQVYKQLHKVWSSIEVQSSYPGNESYKPPNQNQNPANIKSKPKQTTREQKQQEQKQREQEMELTSSFPPGQRWDQSNTILIDDSKLKALSEPFNILEIPEFTNNANLDESKLFSTVLARLDTLSRHDDVSRVLRGWNEMADLQKSSVLDLDIPPEDAEEKEEPWEADDDEEGGISLGEFSISTIPGAPPVCKNGQKKQKKADVNANVNGATTVPKTQPPTDPEAIRLRKEAKKIRKKEKKVAKRAAEESARQETAAAAATAPGEITTTGANPAPGTTTEYIGQRKRKAMKKARLEQEQDPLAQDPATIDPSAPRYSFRTRGAQVSAEAQAQTQTQDGDGTSIPVPTATTTPAFTGPSEGGADTFPAYTHGGRPEDRNRNRSPSSASSAASGNSLLDRLEDGLGFSK
ncbi:hypothetical protein N7509_013304 [Penicillium cosmopolitanum]|uniref:FCP1 homology domain-containing protein n=1 Tax=Penicillium cosmopolitanum TaxID=1131564 RepID=A0A9W9VBW3_9EURO|nr:uncharacterized protein N7509_013304 [Penicillium cosmopolitanum]KAJ5376418.1 hypothetical protein N7509_013304 [Penicillium cosmopolitanum]